METEKSLLGDFYKGRRVFITGHTGFKGSWLSLWLLKLGAVVKGYALEPPTEPSLFDILGLEGKLEHIIADVQDAERLSSELTSFNPDIVFHLAAQPLVRDSYDNPVLTYQTNLLGTINILEAVRDLRKKASVVIITTDKCYENKGKGYSYRETDPLGGYDPYSASKACAEIATTSYRRSFFNPKGFGSSHSIALSSARAGNVIGGGDWAKDRLLPDCFRAFEKGQVVVLRNPDAVRPWQHVFEPLFGYLFLAMKDFLEDGVYSSAWNFGPFPNSVWRVEDIVRYVIERWGSGSYNVSPESEKHEADYLALDIDKAVSVLKWSPKLDVERALDFTVDWYKAYFGGVDMYNFSVNQIDEYERLLG